MPSGSITSFVIPHAHARAALSIAPEFFVVRQRRRQHRSLLRRAAPLSARPRWRRPAQTNRRASHVADALGGLSLSFGGAGLTEERSAESHAAAARILWQRVAFVVGEGREDCGYVVDDGDGESSLDRGSAMFVLSSLPSDCTVLRLRWVGKMDERDREGEGGKYPSCPRRARARNRTQMDDGQRKGAMTRKGEGGVMVAGGWLMVRNTGLP